MRNRVARLAATGLFIVPVLSADDMEAVRQAENEWAQAVMRADAPLLEKILADDLTYTHSSSLTETKEDFIGALRAGAMKYDSIGYDEVKVRVYGDSAVVTANPKMRVISRGQTHSFQVRLLHVYVKQQGRWRLVAHQTTRMNQ